MVKGYKELCSFNVGDKVYVPLPSVARPSVESFSEILFIGQSQVLLRSSTGEEFTRNGDATDFCLWRSAADIRRLLAAGDDLVASIERANGTRKPFYPTLHMRSAIAVWKEIRNA